MKGHRQGGATQLVAGAVSAFDLGHERVRFGWRAGRFPRPRDARSSGLWGLCGTAVGDHEGEHEGEHEGVFYGQLRGGSTVGLSDLRAESRADEALDSDGTASGDSVHERRGRRMGHGEPDAFVPIGPFSARAARQRAITATM
jgi:hypothetical protein